MVDITLSIIVLPIKLVHLLIVLYKGGSIGSGTDTSQYLFEYRYYRLYIHALLSTTLDSLLCFHLSVFIYMIR